MNIPVILDIIIGLFFIYLIFSLLASQIQELLATVLQWRAVHLKKSLEALIAGDTDRKKYPTKFQEARKIVNDIYNNTQIISLNYQSEIGNKIIDWLQRKNRNQNQQERNQGKIFSNNRTGPSYIPSETFSASLIEYLQIPELIQAISETRLEKFKEQKLVEIQTIVNNLNLDESVKNIIHSEFEDMKHRFDGILEDYSNNKTLLNTTVERLSETLDMFIENCLLELPETAKVGREFQQKLRLAKRVFISKSERELLLSEIRPSFTNLLRIVRQVVKTEGTIKSIIGNKEGDIYQEIENTIDALPESLKKNLYVLAKQAETKSQEIGQELNQFQQEIEIWFDNAMDRASGVYKRNARGVAILIGAIIAVSANVDTIYILDYLSKDSLQRAAINEVAKQLVNNQSELEPNDMGKIQKTVSGAVDNLGLPIGHNVKSKDGKEPTWWLGIRKIVGWLLSGIAISMGSSFWFDLLSKIVNIRNVGKKPISSTEKRSLSK